MTRYAREFLSRAKNSVRRSSEASLSSLWPRAFPMADELVSVSSRATTTTGTGVAVFAVFGLYTRVLISWKSLGDAGLAARASLHAWGEFACSWSRVAMGLIAELARAVWIVAIERREGRKERVAIIDRFRSTCIKYYSPRM